MIPKEFYLHSPQTVTTGVVFSSPHSGRDYPAEIYLASELSKEHIRSSEDAYVDQLFLSTPDHGAPLLAASAPRAYVDLNRGAHELDPALIEGVKTSGLNPRVSCGLGVIPRVVSEGRVIRQGKISQREADSRLRQFYHPYHNRLKGLLDAAHGVFGQVLLVDCHSMPHASLANSQRVFGARPEIVLGDRYGASCDPLIMDQIEAIFTMAGFRTARNTPFAGAYITQHYGRPVSGRHALQIEIDRGLYMDETKIAKRAEFNQVQRRLSGVISQICDLGRWPMQVAAE